MDIRLVFILMWCTNNHEKLITALLASTPFDDEEIRTTNDVKNPFLNINSQHISDATVFGKNLNDLNATYNAQNIFMAGQNNHDAKLEKDETPLHDSPLSQYGSAYSYPVPQRKQTPEKLMYTKEIVLKQGRLKGIIRNMHTRTGLKDVDQFFGIPFAEAPVGSRRFMPPGTPIPWKGLKIARHLPPVCPQRIPDVNGNVKLSKGRYEQLARLLPYLNTESEDCLYLNVYVPHGDGSNQPQKYSVIVYVHGESFEWNSGNPYDGSVLASYGQVIVVTINYRLGVLGFLKPGINDETVSNFGLLDQIAALHWIKENIGAFNGDENSVTLMGHSTGAACVNYLMMSPVASGLFHRAILMSGSATADWASSNNSLQLTMQVAHGLNCPLNTASEEIVSCLRSKSYSEIQKISTSSQIATQLGPIVDGHVIPNQPYKIMSQYTDLFSRYDLLFGVTELESFHLFNANQLYDGITENERDNLLRLYMQNRFNVRPDLALAATLKRYTDIYNDPVKASSLEHRDVALDILSDARVVSPLVQTGLLHADVNPRSYMYVFGHNSAAGPHSTLPHSITGEELAFIFGAPLATAGPFNNKFNAQEKLLSEAVMSYWTNFAKTGNPKAPWKGSFFNLHAIEWDRYDLDWPEFNKRNQCYINIGIPPSIGYGYRQVYMNYWNKELPDELNQISSIQKHSYVDNFSHDQMPRSGSSMYTSDIVTGEVSKFVSTHKDRTIDDPQRTLRLLLQKSQPATKETAENLYNAPSNFGFVYHEQKEDVSQITTTPTPTIDTHINDNENIAKSDSTMKLLIGLIGVFIVLNVIIYSTFLIQKKKKTTVMGRKLAVLSYDGTTDDDLKRSKNTDVDDSYILDMVRKSNTYEAVKTIHSSNNGFMAKRQPSSSSIDAHAKVCQWMSKEIMPKETQKSAQQSSPTFSFRKKHVLQRGLKVNVAIDATPQGRSSSVLRQEPIEITKLKTDESQNLIICQEVDVGPEFITEDSIDSKCCQTSASSLHTPTDNIITTGLEKLRADHNHHRTDSFKMYTLQNRDEKVTSFIDEDINVTSREPDSKTFPLTPEQQLNTIKRRNFPKVLPNFPCDSFGKPITVQLIGTNSSNGNERLLNNFKRNSLPLNPFIQTGKIAPTPPPRTISTLDKRPQSLRRQSHSFTTSPVMIAQDCPDEKEPEITQNTLIVGPIIPKRSEKIRLNLNKTKRTDLNYEPTQMNSEQCSSLTPVTLLSIEQSALPVTPAHAHHTEAKYTIQPHISDLTPLIFQQSSQAKSGINSNIPQVHEVGGNTITPSTSSTSAVFGTYDETCASYGLSPLRAAHIVAAEAQQSSCSTSLLHRPESTESIGSRAEKKKTLKSSMLTSSSSSLSSQSSSSGDTTNSSTGTIRTEVKQK